MFYIAFRVGGSKPKRDYISTNITDIAYTAETERTGKKNTVYLDTLCQCNYSTLNSFKGSDRLHNSKQLTCLPQHSLPLTPCSNIASLMSLSHNTLPAPCVVFLHMLVGVL